MKMTNLGLGVFGVLILVTSCASSERAKLAQGDPFADPSKFENLASHVYITPTTAVAPAPAPEPLVKVAEVVASKPVPLQSSLLDGSSLFSSAFEVDSNRAPAAVIIPREESTSPETAYANLIRGNERFVNGTVTGEHRDLKRRRELASAQKPFAIVLSCSDSRVPPELIFDQGLGDLFTVRVAGNVLGSAQVASIEYAVEHLGAKLILVMGHESCGAVKAALETSHSKKHASAGSTDLDWLVTSIRPNLKTRGIASIMADDPKLRKPVMANIDAVTDNLTVRSRIIGEALAKGKLKIVRGIYSLESGRVDFWGNK